MLCINNCNGSDTIPGESVFTITASQAPVPEADKSH
jgi:hypothetical protein